MTATSVTVSVSSLAWDSVTVVVRLPPVEPRVIADVWPEWPRRPPAGYGPQCEAGGGEGPCQGSSCPCSPVIWVPHGKRPTFLTRSSACVLALMITISWLVDSARYRFSSAISVVAVFELDIDSDADAPGRLQALHVVDVHETRSSS